MAATNIAFPLTILVNAVALMLGDGCAANISLCLGRKEQREADSTISHALTLILASGLLAALACPAGHGAVCGAGSGGGLPVSESVPG